VLFDEAQPFAAEHGMEYVETSAQTGQNVEEVFTRLFLSMAVRPVLLWQGSRDGFGAREFHRRCDGHANTLTVIEDTAGNVFGGFTPIAWESPPFPSRRCDAGRKSFRFMARNPRGDSLERFGLIESRKDSAVTVWSKSGPCFGEADVVISDRCDRKPSHTWDLAARTRTRQGLKAVSF
jgi:hypothetical protein